MVAAALHAASAEQNRDAAFDAGTEPLHHFEGRALLVGGALRRFLSSALWNTRHRDSLLLTGLQVLLAEESPIGPERCGYMAERLPALLHHRGDGPLLAGVFVPA